MAGSMVHRSWGLDSGTRYRQALRHWPGPFDTPNCSGPAPYRQAEMEQQRGSQPAGGKNGISIIKFAKEAVKELLHYCPYCTAAGFLGKWKSRKKRGIKKLDTSHSTFPMTRSGADLQWTYSTAELYTRRTEVYTFSDIPRYRQ